MKKWLSGSNYLVIVALVLSSGSLELWGLYNLIGLTPYLVFGAVASIAKISFSKHSSIVPLLFVSTLTFVFALQTPLISIVNPKNCDLELLEYNTANTTFLNYESNMQTYAKQGVARGEIERLEGFKIVKNQQQIALANLSSCKSSVRNGVWIAIIESIITLAVEVMLIVGLRFGKTITNLTKSSKVNLTKIDKVQDVKIDKLQDAKIDKAQDVKIDKFQDAKIDKAQDVKIDKFQDAKIDKAQDVKIDKFQDARIDKVQDVKIDKNTKTKSEIYKQLGEKYGVSVRTIIRRVNSGKIKLNKGE